MPATDRLSSLILAHWSRYHPKMLRISGGKTGWMQALEETAERFADMLVRPGIGAEDGTPPGVGNRDQRDSSAGRVVLDIEPEEKPSRDFRITDAHRIGQGGLQEKARDNIAAIRLLKTLEAENRDATDDEKAVLARYVGWGALPTSSDHYPPAGVEKHGGGGEGTAHRRGI